MTMMQSALRTVESRWAMTKVVRPVIRASMPSWTSFSVRVSMEEVASCLYTQIPESRINTELFNHHQKTEYPYNHTENAF